MYACSRFAFIIYGHSLPLLCIFLVILCACFFSFFFSCVRYALDGVLFLIFFFGLNTLTLYSMHGYWVNHMPSNRFSLINIVYSNIVWFYRDQCVSVQSRCELLFVVVNAVNVACERMNEMLDMIMQLFNVWACSIKCASAVSTFSTVLLELGFGIDAYGETGLHTLDEK